MSLWRIQSSRPLDLALATLSGCGLAMLIWRTLLGAG